MKNWMQGFVTVCAVFGYMALTGFVVFYTVPLLPVERQVELLLLLIGALIGYATGTYQYWIGSSEGSARKSEEQAQERRAARIAEDAAKPKPPPGGLVGEGGEARPDGVGQ